MFVPVSAWWGLSTGSLKLRLTLEAEPRSPKLRCTAWDPDVWRQPATYRAAPVAAGGIQAAQGMDWGGLRAVPCRGESKARSTTTVGDVHPEQQCWLHDMSVALL